MANKLMAWVLLLVSSTYVYFARELSFGSFIAPKAGFLPLIAGILATMLSAVNVIKQWFAKPEKKEQFFWRKFLFIVIGLFSYLIMMHLFGNIVATAVMMFYFLKIDDTPGWIKPMVIAVICAAGFYTVFELFIGNHLP